MENANPGDIVRLTNHMNSTGHCVYLENITNVIFNCNGYNITGDYSGSGEGFTNSMFSPPGNITGLTIQNCPNIGGFGDGINLDYINDSLIENITFIDNDGYSIWSYRSNFTKLLLICHNPTE